MFTKIKNTAIIATAIHFSGVLGHGFVRKITIDGVESVFHIVEFFRITHFMSPCSFPGTNPLVLRLLVSGPQGAYGQPDSRQDLHLLFGPTLAATDLLTMSTARM